MSGRGDDAQARAQIELERWMRRDPKCRELTRAVRAAQRELRESVGDEGWRLYLMLEEHMNARHIVVVAAAMRIASKKKRRPRPAK